MTAAASVSTAGTILDTGGPGEPVILVHGVGAHAGVWTEVAARLAPDFRCIAYDLRGHVEGWCGPFSLADLVADLDRLRLRLGIERVHLAGHSLGGIIVAAYAAAHPESVRSLAIISSAAFRTAEDRSRLDGFLRLLDEQGPAALLPILVDRWYTEPYRAAHPDRVAARLKQISAIDPRVYRQTYRVFATSEVGPLLGGITAPALVMTGENDVGCGPELNRRMAAALPRSELVILPELRHSILVEAPGPVGERLHGFLARVRAEGTA